MTPHRVIVSNGDRTYYGEMTWDGPVDCPPIVTANGICWYAYVWEYNGWTIEDDE